MVLKAVGGRLGSGVPKGVRRSHHTKGRIGGNKTCGGEFKIAESAGMKGQQDESTFSTVPSLSIPIAAGGATGKGRTMRLSPAHRGPGGLS